MSFLTSRRRWCIAIAVLVLLIGGGILYHFKRGLGDRPVPPNDSVEHAALDPRLSYEGPYRNVHPDVGYVGDASCLSCHAKETASFHDHPMGRSLLPIAEVAPRQLYDKDHNNPFQAFGFQLRIDKQGDKVSHRIRRQGPAGDLLVDFAQEVHYAIGSGRGGYSYLTDRDGYLFQTAISWYSQKKIWDLSPGFDPSSLVGRPVVPDCLFCHTNRAPGMRGYKNRYEEPIFDGHVIGCERCHGPGEGHIETVDKQDIVNPKNLTAALHDAVCEQCHLEGGVRVLAHGREMYDFRPGLPLSDFWSVFVPTGGFGEERPAVSHDEQMHESRCYQRSSDDNKMRCGSCHNPHHYVRAAERVAYYRASCLACHEKQGCNLPLATRLQKSKEDSCIECHMPRQGTGDVPHSAASDHRIVRRVRAERGKQMPMTASRSDLPLMPFGRDRVDPTDRRLARDLGIALIEVATRSPDQRRRVAAQALLLLERAGTNDDIEAWEARGWGSLFQDNGKAARAAFDSALSIDPNREVALLGAGEAARHLGQVGDAIGYWRRAVSVNPWMPPYRKELALLLMRKQLWDEVRSQCRTWMQLDPSSAEARMMWVTCLARSGEKDKAREEFARIEALQPPNLDQLRALFAQQMR